MRNDFNRRYRMCLSVRDVLSNYTGIVDAIPGLKACVVQFEDQFQVLDNGTLLTLASTGGTTEVKNQLRDQLIVASFSIANALWSHAAKTKNEVLKEKMPVNLSDFTRGKEVDQIGRIRGVLAEANGLMKEIEEFGISAAFLQKANDDAEDFGQKMNSPKTLRSNNALKLDSLKNDFKAMMDVLERLDRAVNAIMPMQDELYKAYTKARYLGTANLKKEKAEETVERKVFPVPQPSVSRFEDVPAPVLRGGGPYERPMPQN